MDVRTIRREQRHPIVVGGRAGERRQIVGSIDRGTVVDVVGAGDQHGTDLRLDEPRSSAATRSTDRRGWMFESNRSPAMRTRSTFSARARSMAPRNAAKRRSRRAAAPSPRSVCRAPRWTSAVCSSRSSSVFGSSDRWPSRRGTWARFAQNRVRPIVTGSGGRSPCGLGVSRWGVRTFIGPTRASTGPLARQAVIDGPLVRSVLTSGPHSNRCAPLGTSSAPGRAAPGSCLRPIARPRPSPRRPPEDTTSALEAKLP